VSWARAVDPRCMPDRQRLCITVDVEAGTDPLRGSLQTPDSRPRPFWGWLQLIQAIEDAIAPGRQVDAQPTVSRQDTQTNPTRREDSDEERDPQTDRPRDRY
jgi:hypothetical protein